MQSRMICYMKSDDYANREEMLELPRISEREVKKWWLA